MDAIVARQLIDLNRQFYQTFALQFSQTRQRIQPGVRQVLKSIPENASILDLGCGNGELWQALLKSGFQGDYLGLDVSPGLLEIARHKGLSAASKKPVFINADLTTSAWDQDLFPAESTQSAKSNPLQFDFVLAFAVFHHIPGDGLRQDALKKIQRLISPGGQFIHSEWQFLNSDRLKQRIQPWSIIGLNQTSIDKDDYLLDWRHGGQGLRYIHLFQEEELQELAEKAGFEIQDTFYSDGEGGNLSLYQTWTAVK